MTLKRILILGAIVTFIVAAARSPLPIDTASALAQLPAVRAQPPTAEDLDAQARFACREYVKLNLHDPDSAEFGLYRSFPVTHKKSGAVVVQVNLRARNGFNAMRQAVFNCGLVRMTDYYLPVSIKQIQ